MTYIESWYEEAIDKLSEKLQDAIDRADSLEKGLQSVSRVVYAVWNGDDNYNPDGYKDFDHYAAALDDIEEIVKVLV